MKAHNHCDNDHIFGYLFPESFLYFSRRDWSRFQELQADKTNFRKVLDTRWLSTMCRLYKDTMIQLPCYCTCLIIHNTHRCIGNCLSAVIIPRPGVKRAYILVPLIKHTIFFKKCAEINFTYPRRICVFHYKQNGCNPLHVIVIAFSKPCINFTTGDLGFSYIPQKDGMRNHSISTIYNNGMCNHFSMYLFFLPAKPLHQNMKKTN